mmetsp:Transcript_30737/g.78947  ORF Transcript_30737/g.78947 Transcript_30737/m.78947 type:complete len:220 (-) Transcript_30737:110-769(-)
MPMPTSLLSVASLSPCSTVQRSIFYADGWQVAGLLRFVLRLGRPHRVVLPYAVVERRSEANPGGIRHHQPRRDVRHGLEGDSGAHDGWQQRRNINQRDVGPLGPEEQRRPREVEAQLHAVQAQCQGVRREAAHAPNQPASHTHRGVQAHPYHGECPVGRRPGGATQRLVPALHSLGRGEAACDAATERDQNGQRERQRGAHIVGLIGGTRRTRYRGQAV